MTFALVYMYLAQDQLFKIMVGQYADALQSGGGRATIFCWCKASGRAAP